MENLILLLLFTYPGAIAEWIYSALSSPYDYYKPLDGVRQTARYFVLSVICTSLSLVILPFCFPHQLQFTISSVVQALKTTDTILVYVPLSVIVCVAFGCLLFIFRHLIYQPIRNKIAEKRRLYIDTGTKDVWTYILSHPDKFDPWDCAVVLKKQNKILACGLPYSFPVESGKGEYALMYCDDVLEEINKGEKSEKIGNHLLTYYEAKSDLTVEFWQADVLWACEEQNSKKVTS